MNRIDRKSLVAGYTAIVALAGGALAGLSGCAAIPQDQPRLSATGAADMGLSAATGYPPPSHPVAANTPPVQNAPVSAPPVSTDVSTIAPDWWQALGDPQLDRIMADALAGNPTLQQAISRLELAQSAIGLARAQQLPQVSADASSQYQRFSGKYIYPPPYAGSWYWMSNATATVSWSLDIAGKQKAMVEGARAYTASSAYDLAAARVTLAGSVAQTYVNLARADAQVRLARDVAASRGQNLRLTQERRKAQLVSDIDIHAAETLLAEARQAQVQAEGNRAQMVHALAALAGRGADYYATIAAPTLRFDTALAVPAALPADLLGRRADILAARAMIEVGKAGQTIARAAFYPNVDIKAFIGSQALGIGSLFTSGALVAGAGPAIHLPIFEGGALRARYKAAIAQNETVIAQYNGTVVKAVQEAADALSAVETNRADAAQQQAILTGLEKTVALDHVRVSTGLATRFDLLNADDRLLTARQAQVNIAADGAIRRIQLLVALGAGFTTVVK